MFFSVAFNVDSTSCLLFPMLWGKIKGVVVIHNSNRFHKKLLKGVVLRSGTFSKRTPVTFSSEVLQNDPLFVFCLIFGE